MPACKPSLCHTAGGQYVLSANAQPIPVCTAGLNRCHNCHVILCCNCAAYLVKPVLGQQYWPATLNLSRQPYSVAWDIWPIESHIWKLLQSVPPSLQFKSWVLLTESQAR